MGENMIGVEPISESCNFSGSELYMYNLVQLWNQQRKNVAL